ncbi:MAG: hypothetical protein QOF52_434, partial [Propionibacteriaceae bacterium]|nr:hypothetical protein [Propionibacteriaceae bacterium]
MWDNQSHRGIEIAGTTGAGRISEQTLKLNNHLDEEKSWLSRAT